MISQKTLRRVAVIWILALGVVGIHRAAIAAQLTLTWSDNSSNESGFNIERRVGITGSYTQLASVGINVNSYSDSNLLNSTTYCYRVQSYNSAGLSGHSNEGCATTAAVTTSYTLTVSKSGTGSGTVTGTGISCGADCSEVYTGGTSVVLTAVVAAGSTFGGWSGNGCTTGTVTVNGNMTCTAIFNMGVAAQLTLSWTDNSTNEDGFNVERRIGITGSYTQLASVGINVNSYSDSNLLNSTTYCYRVQSYNSAGLSGYSNEGCATTAAATTSYTLTVSKSGTGSGTVTGTGISCGVDCSEAYTNGTSVALTAVAASISTFAGWSGGGCTGTPDCSVTLTSASTIMANFVNDLVDKVGVYRPSTGEWFLDSNGNGIWDGCEIDFCVETFGATGALPVVGDWDGSGFTKLGLFQPSTAQWWLDTNGDHVWDEHAGDQRLGPFGKSSDIPFSGRWTNLGHDRIGTYRPSTGTWHLDKNDNGALDCRKDYCPRLRNYAIGDLPVVGDWTGSGTSRVGLYRPSTGQWFLDRNGSRSWNGCSKDTCVNDFGAAGDLPTTGDWSGNGISKIGIFRPSTQEWMLDLNANGSWDGCDVDLCVSGFGAEGDIPVVGRW